MQRAAIIAPQNLGFGVACLGHGTIGEDGNVGLQLGVELLDAVQKRARQLDRRQLPALQQAAGLADGQVTEFCLLCVMAAPQLWGSQFGEYITARSSASSSISKSTLICLA